MSMGPFEAGFVSQRDKNNMIEGSCALMTILSIVFESGVVVCWEHSLVQVNLSFIHLLHICCHYHRIARCYIDKKLFLLLESLILRWRINGHNLGCDYRDKIYSFGAKSLT